jgi:hypothetical protein
LVRELHPGYCYLEIGSDMGGSLLPHLLDPNCSLAISIDPRPEVQPDERGIDFHYPGNSTARMVDQLARHVSAHELGKLSTIEADISAVDRARLPAPPQLVLIDAEHTNFAAFSDFIAVLPLISDNALVTFHDANLVGDAIQITERFLVYARIRHSLVILPSCVAVFAFGAFIGPANAALAPYAEPAPTYFAAARRQRLQAVADSVIRQTPGLRGHGITELMATITDLEHRVAVAQTAADATLAENERLRLALHQAQAATDAVVSENAQLRLALHQAKTADEKRLAEIEALIASTSWRVTAPMRTVARLLRGEQA